MCPPPPSQKSGCATVGEHTGGLYNRYRKVPQASLQNSKSGNTCESGPGYEISQCKKCFDVTLCSVYARVHQLKILFLNVNNSICLGMNIAPMHECGYKIFSQSVRIYRCHMASEYYHYIAMASPPDYGIYMFEGLHGAHSR